MKKLSIILTALMSIAGICNAYEFSDYIWSAYNGHLYTLTKDYSNFSDAQNRALEVGGHLVVIHDADENTWLAALIKNSYVYDSNDVMNNLAWIGLSYTSGDRAQPTSWIWVNNEQVSYWNPYDEGLSSGNYMYMHGDNHPIATGQWNCNYVHYMNYLYYPKGIIEYTPFQIFAPTSGEQLTSLHTTTIEWEPTETTNNVKIEVSFDNGSNWQTVTESTSNTGQYQWSVPHVNSDTCFIQISDVDNPNIFNTSDVFTIIKYTPFQIYSPTVDDQLVAGQPTIIEWEPTEGSASVKIEFSSDNGLSWQLVIESTPNDGQYQWTTPIITSNLCLISITDVDDPDIFNTSEDAFTIYICRLNSPADLNDDCRINLGDLMIVAQDWMRCGNPFDPDFTEYTDDMIFIQGGQFQMGDSFDEGYYDEQPVHTVQLTPYYIGPSQVTNEQYCEFLNSAFASNQITVFNGVIYDTDDTSYIHPYFNTKNADPQSQIQFADDTFSVSLKADIDMSNHPVVEVSFFGAAAYCNWLSSQHGYETLYDTETWQCYFDKQGYRLPTEAEWEFVAASAGINSSYRFPWGDTITHSRANYYSTNLYDYDISPLTGYHPDYSDVYPYTSPIASFPPNTSGLYDMAGNVAQWCNDWYNGVYYSISPEFNPTGPLTGSSRILRGGSWDTDAYLCRMSCRMAASSDHRDYDIGFRIVLDMD